LPAVPPIVPSVGHIHAGLSDTDLALGYSGGVTPADPVRFVYSRHGGPNQAGLEEAVSALEGAEGAVSFSSGMAALHAALLVLVQPGGAIVAAEQLYGVTRSLLEHLKAGMGLRVAYADFLDAGAVRPAVEAARPSVLLCEVLTNPLARVVPLRDIVEIGHHAQARVLVDNTFATPLLLRPLECGADMVVHSSTKYINGHGDVLGGVAAGSADAMRQVYQHRRILGSVPSAFDAWLTLRGLRTLGVRMLRCCANALQIAEWLEKQEWVGPVYYPGLPGDASHAAARLLFRAGCFGSILAFEVKGLDRAGAFAFVERLRLIRPVTSLGDVFTLIMHPASASHRALTPEQRERQGITEGLLRLSVGIEDPADLIADLRQAAGAVAPR
jgi:cystathionine gamma-synthase/methionine-gamma-lyase